MIIYTRHNGSVGICQPMAECVSAMGNGGYWSDRPRGFIEAQIERRIAGGRPASVARRFVNAVAFGGCTEAEAYEIIRDLDIGHLGTAFERIDQARLPDLWFFDAWRRSHNGGPISIDMKTARKIQLKYIKNIAEKLHIDINIHRYKTLARMTKTPEHLKTLWPKSLRKS